MRSRWLVAAVLFACTAAHAQGAAPVQALESLARDATWAGLSEKAETDARRTGVQAHAARRGALEGLTFQVVSTDAMADLVFNTAGHASTDASLDAENSSGVPEPETYALLLSGFGAIAFAVRRRRRDA